MLSSKTSIFRYFIELSFNGTDFHGWQIQPGADSVQETLNHAIGLLVGEPVNLTGCGRTDAGVHASHFVAHFDAEKEIGDCGQLTLRLNRLLNKPVRINRVIPVDPDAHARFHAVARTYQYLVSLQKQAFISDFSWYLPKTPDVGAMNEACTLIKGRHDFTSFSKLHTDVRTNICTVTEAGWQVHGDLLLFRICADRFLRNMVRAIVGTLIEVGKGRISPETMSAILEAKDRSKAGMSVPAKGLFLTRVDYPPEIFTINPKPPFPDWGWLDQPV